MGTRTKVLVVDDRAENRASLIKMIKPLGIEVVEADSGQSCLASVLENDFALIFLDVEMPGMDGFETAELLRGDAEFRNVPIIFVTAHDEDTSDLFRGYASGAVDFLRKPLRQGVVTSKAKVFIRLYEQRRELEESRSAFAQFAYKTSHDLKSPLRQIRVFSQLAMSDAVDLGEQAREHLERIEAASGRMLNLMDSLLDYARIGRSEVNLESCDLEAIFQEVLDDLDHAIQASGSRIKCRGLKQSVHGDWVLLYQLFQNIVANSIKYRRSGVTPEVRIEVHEDDAVFHVQISDNGQGFTAEEGAKLFEPFYRVQRSASAEGAGIGLATCREIVERHHGKIKAFGVPGQGATIVVSLPKDDTRQVFESLIAPIGSNPALDPASSGMFDRLSTATPIDSTGLKIKVVVVDDDSNEHALTSRLLGGDFDLHLVGSAEECLEYLDCHSNVDVVLTDYQMPGTNGVELLKEVRDRFPSVTRILMSSSSKKEIDEECPSAVFQAFITKCVSSTDLSTALESIEETHAA